MSDLMFYGVLRMPYEMAMGDVMSSMQFYSKAQEAADRVERLEAENAELRAALAPKIPASARGCGTCPKETPYGLAACGKCVDEDNERSAFEAHIASECDSEEYASLILQRPGIAYSTTRIQGAWEGWKARGASIKSAMPPGRKLVPISASNEIICAIEAMVDQQLIASGSSPADMVRQDGGDIWDAAIAAAPAAPGDPTGITDTMRMDYVAKAHLGGSHAGITSINPIIHFDDYHAGGARYAIDCMIERNAGRDIPMAPWTCLMPD